MSLQIKLLEVEINKPGADIFSLPDPYVILRLGDEEKHSKTKEEGGQKVSFNETFSFKSHDNRLKITLLDQDTFCDDTLGEGQLDLTQYRGKSSEQQAFVVLNSNGQAAARISFTIWDQAGTNQFGGNGGNQWGGNNQFGGQGGQGGWGGQGGQGGWGGQGGQGGQGGFGGGNNTGNINPLWGAAEQLGKKAQGN